MLRRLFLIAALTSAFPVLAAESCAMQAAVLLSQGKQAELATRFKGTDPTVAAGMARLAMDLGRVDSVTPIARLSEGKTSRLAVSAPGLPSSYAFEGTWAAAQSQNLGRIELQAAVVPDGKCTLLSLQVHVR